MFGQASFLRDTLATNANGRAAVLVESTGSGTVRLYNVTAIATGDNSYGIIVQGDAVDPFCVASNGLLLVENVIARGTAADMFATEAHDATCSPPAASIIAAYSNFRDVDLSGSGTFTEGDGNQRSAAQTNDAAIFANTTNYRQRDGAPTYNAGREHTGDSERVDPDGDPRVVDGAVDIGADELPVAPAATTGGPTIVGATSAEVTGSVDGRGHPVTYTFDYGPTTAFGSSTPAESLDGVRAAHLCQRRPWRACSEPDHLLPPSRPIDRSAAADDGWRDSFVYDAAHAGAKCRYGPAHGGGCDVGAVARLGRPERTCDELALRVRQDLDVRRRNQRRQCRLGGLPVSVSRELTDLKPATTYHYRLEASSEAGAGTGSDQSFRTKRLKVRRWRSSQALPARLRFAAGGPGRSGDQVPPQRRCEGEAEVPSDQARAAGAEGCVQVQRRGREAADSLRGPAVAQEEAQARKSKLVVRAKTAGFRSKKVSAKFRLLRER